MEPSSMGEYIWRVAVNGDEIYLYADEVKIECGKLVFWGGYRKTDEDGCLSSEPVNPRKIIAVIRDWESVYQVSLFDRSPLCIEYVHFGDPK